MSNTSDNQYWANQPQDMYDGFNDKSQVLDFQTFNPNETAYWNDASQTDPGYNQLPDAASRDPYGMMQQQTHYGPGPSIFTPNYVDDNGVGSSPGMGIETTEFDEPPLLDELEIYPRRIMEKAVAVLNPFQSSGTMVDTPDYLFKETDLAGPIIFCLTLAACLSISNSKAQFGYIYGLSTISVLAMYCLIWLMCHAVEWHVTVSGVASVLGYSMLPVVFLAVIGMFTSLNNFYGMLLAGSSILLATVYSSRMFCLMTGDPHQRYLIAYPSSLLFTIFSMLVLF
ncbi:protein YIPF5 homolog [Anopheles marshallii]|uniref:protein YIPF5 homolog n=1 Tax=Anopheles marshallii TaxID=1521116 RepID=UPI00237A25AF|nr:protein YIPF5 homolog [Anopheles marshallii]